MFQSSGKEKHIRTYRVSPKIRRFARTRRFSELFEDDWIKQVERDCLTERGDWQFATFLDINSPESVTRETKPRDIDIVPVIPPSPLLCDFYGSPDTQAPEMSPWRKQGKRQNKMKKKKKKERMEDSRIKRLVTREIKPVDQSWKANDLSLVRATMLKQIHRLFYYSLAVHSASSVISRWLCSRFISSGRFRTTCRENWFRPHGESCFEFLPPSLRKANHRAVHNLLIASCTFALVSDKVLRPCSASLCKRRLLVRTTRRINVTAVLDRRDY